MDLSREKVMKIRIDLEAWFLIKREHEGEPEQKMLLSKTQAEELWRSSKHTKRGVNEHEVSHTRRGPKGKPLGFGLKI